jgi:hypothetical protein
MPAPGRNSGDAASAPPEISVGPPSGINVWLIGIRVAAVDLDIYRAPVLQILLHLFLPLQLFVFLFKILNLLLQQLVLFAQCFFPGFLLP